MANSYDDLSTLIDQVTEAAINAAMRSVNVGSTIWRFEGSCATKAFHGTVNVAELQYGEGFEPVQMLVTYPGGEWYALPYGDTSERVPWASTGWAKSGCSVPFDAVSFYLSWQQTIGDAFTDWWFLPDPAGFQGQIESISKVAHDLDAGGVFTVGSGSNVHLDGGNLEINDYASYIESKIGQFDGAMIDSLDAFYVSRLRPTITGQQVAASVMLTLALGEQEIWKRARKDVVTICEQARNSFQAIADEPTGDGGWSGFFSVAGTVAAIAGIFVTGGAAATVIGDAGAIIGIVQGFMPDPPAKKNGSIMGSTVDAVTASLEKSLQTLNDSIYDQEFAFEQCGDRAVAYFQDHQDYISIAVATAVPGFLDDDNGQYFAPGENIRVLTSELPRIAARFELIGDIQATQLANADAALGDGPWTRNMDIGYTQRGHYYGYLNIYSTLESALTSSAHENRSVARRLIAVADDFDATEAQIVAELNTIDRGVQATEARLGRTS